MAQPPPPAGPLPSGSVTPTSTYVPLGEPTLPGQVPARPDLAANLTDRIDELVGMVRDRTTRPALLASRALVFGLIIAILALVALTLVCIAWTTAWTALFGEVWITYFFTGGIFVIAGAFLMAKRRPPEIEL
jgi:hypothetical protein